MVRILNSIIVGVLLLSCGNAEKKKAKAPLRYSECYFEFAALPVPVYVDVLNVSGRLVTNLDALIRCTNLQALVLRHNPIDNISVLSNIKTLTYLDISRTYVKDISPIAHLRQLTNINIRYAYVADLAFLPSSITVLYVDRDMSKDIINSFKRIRPNCKILYNDGYSDSGKKPRGPLDARVLANKARYVPKWAQKQ